MFSIFIYSDCANCRIMHRLDFIDFDFVLVLSSRRTLCIHISRFFKFVSSKCETSPSSPLKVYWTTNRLSGGPTVLAPCFASEQIFLACSLGSVEVANIDGARATSGVNEYPVIHSTRRPASSLSSFFEVHVTAAQAQSGRVCSREWAPLFCFFKPSPLAYPLGAGQEEFWYPVESREYN